MYCINCRYYDRNSSSCYTKTCLNRDGLKRQLIECDFCSYCEPISDFECICGNCEFYKSEMNGTGFCKNIGGLNQCVFKSDYCSSFTLSKKCKKLKGKDKI